MCTQDGVGRAVSHIRNSIGYVGPDSTSNWGDFDNSSSHCQIREAAMINKAGRVISASVSSAQAAVRSSAMKLLGESSCPGFGLCGNIQDGADEDVWPITAITASGAL